MFEELEAKRSVVIHCVTTFISIAGALALTIKNSVFSASEEILFMLFYVFNAM